MFSGCSQKLHIFDQVEFASNLPEFLFDTILKFVLTTEQTTRAKRNGGFIIHFPWQLKCQKRIWSWTTGLGLNKTAAKISYISKTHYRNNDILVTSGFLLCKWKKTLKCTVESCQSSLVKTFQWLPTGYGIKSELFPLDHQEPEGAALASSLISYHTFLLIGYAPATMNILFVPGMCQGHFLLMAFTFYRSPRILLPTLPTVP